MERPDLRTHKRLFAAGALAVTAAMLPGSPAVAGNNGQQLAFRPNGSVWVGGTLTITGPNQNRSMTTQTIRLNRSGTTYDTGWWWTDMVIIGHQALHQYTNVRVTDQTGRIAGTFSVDVPISCNTSYFPINLPDNNGNGGGPAMSC